MCTAQGAVTNTFSLSLLRHLSFFFFATYKHMDASVRISCTPKDTHNKMAWRTNIDAVKSASGYKSAHCVCAVNVSHVFYRGTDTGLYC